MNPVDLRLNIDDEITEMEQYVAAHWDNVRNLRPALKELHQRASHDARAFFKENDAWLAINALEQKRMTVISKLLQDPEEIDFCGYYDAVFVTLKGINNNLSYMGKVGRDIDGPWDFSSRVNPHLKAIFKRFPDLAHASLKSVAGEKVFQGSHIGSIRANEFPDIVTGSGVGLEKSVYGRSAAHALLSAAYVHFLGIAEMLNTLALARDIEQFIPVSEPGLKFSPIISGQTGNKLLDAALSLCDPVPSESEFLEAVAKAKEFRKKSHEDQAKEVVDHGFSISDLDQGIAESRRKAVKALKRCFGSADRRSEPSSLAP